MKDEVIKQGYMATEPKRGYQCPECGNYFNDKDFSSHLEQGNSLCCPYCSEWMEIIDTDNKIVNHYKNMKYSKKKE